MPRLASTFTRLRAEGRTGLVTYVAAGDPDLDRSARVVLALDRAGADVIEVGVPFSDPVADGPVIQRAVERALAAGGCLGATLELIGGVRPHVSAPLVLFTYANPVLKLGVDRFAARAAAAGVDGALVLDLPIEEASDFRSRLADAGLDMIFLVSPTTTDRRLAEASRLGSGFLYAISRLGVTVSKRVAPRAVSRNFAKRLVREGFRRAFPANDMGNTSGPPLKSRRARIPVT